MTMTESFYKKGEEMHLCTSSSISAFMRVTRYPLICAIGGSRCAVGRSLLLGD